MTPTPPHTPERSQTSWLPFQCPSCFSLFRARRDRLEQVGECPSCLAKVRLSKKQSAPNQKSAKTLPTGAKSTGLSQGKKRDEVNKDGLVKKRRYSQSGGREESPDWETSDEKKSGGISWMMVVSVLTAVVFIFAGISFYLKMKPESKTATTSAPLLVSESDSKAIEASLALTRDTKKEEIENTATELIEKFETFDLVAVREVIRKFLTAKTVEEKSRYVRDSIRLFEPMQEYYRTRGYQPEGFRKFEERQISYLDDFLSTVVRLEDFSNQPIAVMRDGDDYFVDWESWVGYCSVSVEEILKNRPAEPVEIRALMREQNYYNYHFEDDRKWKSFRLTFSSSEGALWGYVDRTSELWQRMKNSPSHPVILTVAFPEGSRGRDQVQIVDRIASGWVKRTPQEKTDE